MKFGSRLRFGWQKHKPEIFIAAGIVSFAASIPFWVRSTLKVHDVLDQAKGTMADIKTARDDESLPDYTEDDAKKDTFKLVVHTTGQILKYYSLPFAMDLFGGVCILTSHKILRERNAAIAGAYTALETGFKEYRKRVVEKYGSEEDRMLRYNPELLETHQVEIEEDGKKKKIDVNEYKVLDTDRLKRIDLFSRFFDEANPFYEKMAGANLAFLRAKQNMFNMKLTTVGYVFLNDVYRELGYPETKEGQEFGWIYDPNDKDFDGDNFIDFGLGDIHDEKIREFLNSQERSILLEFNVDPEPILYSSRLRMPDRYDRA